MNKSSLAILASLLLLTPASRASLIFVDFNNTSDLTTKFATQSGEPKLSNVSDGGINNSGSVSIPDGVASPQVWTLQSGFANGGSSYSVSGFWYNYINGGYGGFGFASTSNPAAFAGALGVPEGGLGIAIHGGGGEWQSVSGGELVGSSSSSWGSDTPLDSWLYFTLTMAYAGSNTYNLQIRINSADSSGNIGPLFSEKSVSLSNPDLAAAETIYPYFSVDGGRYSTFDNFAASNEAAPVPEPGTWAAAAMLAGGAGLMRWRKRVKIS